MASRRLRRVHGVTLLYDDLDEEWVGFFFPRRKAVVMRIGADPEDQAALLASILARLGGATPRPAAPLSTALALVPSLRAAGD
jgi:hypothetical protein